MTNKEKLLGYIKERPSHIVNDADTFLWARTTHYQEFSQKGLGGGNFLIALGLFATLNYLGKIYHLLRGKSVFMRGVEAKEAHGKLPDAIKALLIPIRDGFIDETQAFTDLVSDAPGIGKLGLRKGDIVQAYKDVRHMLTHMIAPRAGNIMLANVPAGTMTFEEAKKTASFVGARSVEYKGHIRKVDVDLLNRDVAKVRDWLAAEVQSGKYDANTDTTLDWIEKTLG